MTSLTPEKIAAELEGRSIQFRLMEHEAVSTSEEAARVRGVPLRTGAKALVVKGGFDLALVVIPADRRLDLPKLGTVIEFSGVSLASPAEAEERTGLQVGAIPPFGNLLGFDETVMDSAVLENDLIRFNAASRTHSIEMRASDLAEVVRPTIGEITETE